MESTTIRVLSPQAFDEIGKKLDLAKDWKDLAFYCIHSTHIDTMQIEYTANRKHKSATVHVLEEWVKVNASATVGDLISHLKFMNRHDVIQVIHELWENKMLSPHQVSGGSFCQGMPPSQFTHQSSVDKHNGSITDIADGSPQGLSNNSPMSSIIKDEFASPCLKPQACTCTQQCDEQSHRSYQEITSPRVNEHSKNPKTQSTFLHLVPDDYNPSKLYLTWPKTPEKVASAYTPRSWVMSGPAVSPFGSAGSPYGPGVSPSGFELSSLGSTVSQSVPQQPQVSGRPTSAPQEYKYNGPGLISHVPSNKGYVFITYSATSSKHIQPIHNALQMEGYTVLTDVKRSVLQQPESKTTEDQFKSMLVTGLKNCKYVLCLLCEDYMRELKDERRNLMNIQLINQLMEEEYNNNDKQNKRFIPFCLSECMSVSALPQYLTNCPSETQEMFVTVLNKALGKKSNLVIYKVENKTKKHKLRFFSKFK